MSSKDIMMSKTSRSKSPYKYKKKKDKEVEKVRHISAKVLEDEHRSASYRDPEPMSLWDGVVEVTEGEEATVKVNPPDLEHLVANARQSVQH